MAPLTPETSGLFPSATPLGPIVTNYNYTVQPTDTLTTIETASDQRYKQRSRSLRFTPLRRTSTTRFCSTSLIPGPAGENLGITASVVGPTTVLSCRVSLAPVGSHGRQFGPLLQQRGWSAVTNANPAVPGEILYLLSTGIGPTTPSDQDTGEDFHWVEAPILPTLRWIQLLSAPATPRLLTWRSCLASSASTMFSSNFPPRSRPI